MARSTRSKILEGVEDLYAMHRLEVNGKTISKKLTPRQYSNAIDRANKVGGDPYVIVNGKEAFIFYPKKKTTAKKTTAKKTTTKKKTTRVSAATKLAKIRKILC